MKPVQSKHIDSELLSKPNAVVAAFDVGKTTGGAVCTPEGSVTWSMQGDGYDVWRELLTFTRERHVLAGFVIEGSFTTAKAPRADRNHATWVGGGLAYLMRWTGLCKKSPAIVNPSTWRTGIGIKLTEPDPSLGFTKAGTVRHRRRRSRELEDDAILIAKKLLNRKLLKKEIHEAEAACIAWWAARKASGRVSEWPSVR